MTDSRSGHKGMAIRTNFEFSMWVIYDHPSDYPTSFVARQYRLSGEPGGVPTEHAFAHDDLKTLRQVMWKAGLKCMERHPDDDPVIIEVWL